MLENVLGIKLGSQWTVAYGKGVAPLEKKVWGPRVELTCVHQVPAHLLRKLSTYRFSHAADPFDGSIYPLEFGLPRDDREVPLKKSVMLLREYVNWLLNKADEDMGIVFCLPMMKHEEGLNQLKVVLNGIEKGNLGKRFIMEAWAASLATIGVEKTLESQVIALNFGSSTLEVALYAGKTLIAQNVYPFGGWELDGDLASAISQAHRGITVTPRQTRIVKESFNYENPEPVDGTFTRRGGAIEVHVQPETMIPVIEHFAEKAAYAITHQFLPTASRASEKAVAAIQTEGIGYLCVCGGLSCMPGFADLIGRKLVEVGGINDSLGITSPVEPDGVTAPAWGAYMMAELLEEERERKKRKTW